MINIADIKLLAPPFWSFTVDSHTGAGGGILYGCAIAYPTYNYNTQFNIGDTVYVCQKAERGCLEPIVIQDIRLIQNRYGSLLFYLVKDNWKYQDWQLCGSSGAQALATAWYEKQAQFAQELICR